ncbi:response regulator transcription factor [Lentibacillus cibarius]|uniref:Response regulator transcription factor n=1 Tax=Lentibacillus cibarius TaxID=2583219 RepID=A0A549YGE9_9BACI|nr:LytTR family DNA-binding domain-containing protein [Lentibacillus cibarius]TMN22182.1 response regulator transcription factor [Lentibacillus cibarius]TRM10962.1 response regulator transcription factor [Lentibacillus cibarius]
MKRIHVMIAEDEELAREELIYLLKEEPDVVISPGAETGEQLIDLYTKHEPDVIFLDVQMPEMSGVEAAKQITAISYQQPPLFVFTTAYDTYALDAFDIEAVDYLLKPYDDNRFQQAMKRVRKHLTHNGANQGTPALSQQASPASKLLIDDGERMVVLSPDSIYYAVPANRMLEIHTKDEIIESRMTLQELEEKLYGLPFFRIHRSYLVNLNHVREITPWFNGAYNVTLKDKHHTTLPVSRSARKILLETFKN